MAVWTTLGIGLRPGEEMWDKFGDVGESSGLSLEMRGLIEKGYVVGIYDGCTGGNPPNFCPNNNILRDQMAKFMVNAWDL